MYARKHQLTTDEVKFICANWNAMTPDQIAKVLNFPSSKYLMGIVGQIRKAGYPLSRKQTPMNGKSVRSVIAEAVKDLPPAVENAIPAGIPDFKANL